jgi:beta-lactamase class A
MTPDTTPDTTDTTALRARVDEPADALVASGGPSGDGDPVVSVWLGDLEGRVYVERDADVPHYAASTMKLPLLVAALRRHESGELDLDQQVPVHNRFASAADGSPFSLDQAEDQDDDTWAALGGQRSLRSLAEHMTVKSGNLATNLVLEHVGAGAVAEVLSHAGASTTTVLTRGIEDAVAREAGLDNLVTAADLGLVLRGVAARTLARPDTCAGIEAVLARQEHRSGVPAGLPAGTYVANKTGWVDGITHDVALVRPDDRPPYVLVVLTTLDLAEAEAHKLIADVSRTVWEGWQG